jgi:hypothetical protein
VSDDWKGVAAFHFLTQTPADSRTVGETLEYWSRRLVGQSAPEKIRPTLLQILADSDDAKPETEFSGDDKDRAGRLVNCVALLAASPEFQYR